MNIFYKTLKRGLWTALTSIFAVLMVGFIVGGVIADGFKRTINDYFGMENYRTEVDENAEKVHYESEFQKADGTYDDAALWNEGVKVSDRIQREGTTILWNKDKNGNVGLPLGEGTKVSLFSHSVVDFVYSGVGSGGVLTRNVANLKTAFENAGLKVNDTLWNFYKSGPGSDDKYKRATYSKVSEVPWSLVNDNCKSSFNGTAGVFVISRQAGESGETDASMSTADTITKDYFSLHKNEKESIEGMIQSKKNGALSKVIVMLNTAAGINFDLLAEYKDDIDCCIWVCQPGWEGINEIGRIFSGKSVPSGHIVDTFLYNNFSAPASVNAEFMSYSNAHTAGLKDMQFQANYIIYAENIYVGYKYFETRYEDAVMNQGNASSKTGAKNSSGNWKYGEEVAFPFGYGVTYTDFDYSGFSVTKNDNGDYDVSLTVTNTGSAAGMDAVQIYIQKPYTAYDKQHGLEQSAVNLCGYKKTGLIAAGGSEEVTVTVSKDAFKTYDDDGYKTYIMEDGVYYITAAKDAHDATNNILSKKGYTPTNTSGVMDAEGKSSLVWEWENKKLDTSTFAKSSTNYDITNRFEDTDWNKYEHKTDGEVTYLSRSDWSGTWPRPLSLSLNAEMVKDLDWDKEIIANPNDKFPKYEQEHLFDIVDMRGLEYRAAAWDTLLDQTSLEEQITFLGKAYHGCPAILSINFVGEKTADGPMGLRQRYKTDANAGGAGGYCMSFPCEPLLAASFNDELAYRAGQLKGEDMLHVGYTGIYGTAPNLHRTIWGGRAYEYYSEDGFISGIMAKWETMGIQERGNYVNLKHFALNDQESNRHGVNIWSNEQAIREIYLLAFQPSVEEAKAKGIMSSFTRFGTLWSGAHRGLCTEVLRNEWGFDGFVISDCAWRKYMGVVDGLAAGNDNILYESTDLTAYYDARTNPTVAKLIRESTHRVLYVLANSNAMEGYAPGMKIIPVTNWWQGALIAAQAVFGVLTVASAAFMVMSYVFVNRRKEVLKAEGKMNSEGRYLDKNGGIKSFKVRNIALITSATAVLLAIVLVVSLVIVPMIQSIFAGEDYEANIGGGGGAVHVCAHVCAVCGKCKDETCENAVCSSKCGGHLVETLPEGYTTYTFEAECSKLVTSDPASCKAGNEGKQTNNPGGGQYIMNMSKVSQASCTFNITSDKAEKAVLFLRMGHREAEFAWNKMFTMTVNGATVSSDYVFPVMRSGGRQYFDWQDNEIAIIDLKAGDNVIVLNKVTNGLNFDSLKLATVAELKWTSEVGKGHTYGDWELVTAPTETERGLVGSYCVTCRDYKEAKLPAISEDNGYTKKVIKEAGPDSFGEAEWSYMFEGCKFGFRSLLYPTSGETSLKRFECEDMRMTGTAKVNREGGSNNPSGGYYVAGFSSNDASIIFEFESDKETDVVFYIGFGCRNDRTINFNNAFILSLNGSRVTVGKDVEFTGADSTFNYFNWQRFMIVTLHVTEGTNRLVLEDNNKAVSSNLDYFEFLGTATLTAIKDE